MKIIQILQLRLSMFGLIVWFASVSLRQTSANMNRYDCLGLVWLIGLLRFFQWNLSSTIKRRFPFQCQTRLSQTSRMFFGGLIGLAHDLKVCISFNTFDDNRHNDDNLTKYIVPVESDNHTQGLFFEKQHLISLIAKAGLLQHWQACWAKRARMWCPRSQRQQNNSETSKQVLISYKRLWSKAFGISRQSETWTGIPKSTTSEMNASFWDNT